jgi:SPP1 family predicted phage head-tail adaptor
MMKHRIKLLKRADGIDSVGQPSKEWVQVAEVWGDVMFPSGAMVMRAGTEVVRAGTEASIVKASIRIRARAGVDATYRAVYRDWTFDIKAPPLPDKDPRFAFLVCEAVK